jgi:hypothetical protein
LRVVAIEGDRVAIQSLNDEVAHHAIVFEAHPRFIGV